MFSHVYVHFRGHIPPLLILKSLLRRKTDTKYYIAKKKGNQIKLPFYFKEMDI